MGLKAKILSAISMICLAIVMTFVGVWAVTDFDFIVGGNITYTAPEPKGYHVSITYSQRETFPVLGFEEVLISVTTGDGIIECALPFDCIVDNGKTLEWEDVYQIQLTSIPTMDLRDEEGNRWFVYFSTPTIIDISKDTTFTYSLQG